MNAKPKREKHFDPSHLDSLPREGKQEIEDAGGVSLPSPPKTRRLQTAFIYIARENTARLTEIQQDISPYIVPASMPNLFEWLFLEAKDHPEIVTRMQGKATAYHGKAAYLGFQSKEEIQDSASGRSALKTTAPLDARVYSWVMETLPNEGKSRCFSVVIQWAIDDWEWVKKTTKFKRRNPGF